MIFGLEKYGENSKYLKDINLNKNEVIISSGLKEKYKLNKNSNITLFCICSVYVDSIGDVIGWCVNLPEKSG